MIKLDGTENKSRLGANAILSVSLSFARACAAEQKLELYEYLNGLIGNDYVIPAKAGIQGQTVEGDNTLDSGLRRNDKTNSQSFNLPQPYFNVINGGKHADSGLDIQEFLIVPVGFDSFKRKVEAADEIIAALKKILVSKNYSIGVGDEGGFAPKLSSNEEAFELLEQAIKDAGYNFNQVKLAIDAAASSFYVKSTYRLKIYGEDKNMGSRAMVDWYKRLVGAHPIVSIEDGLAEDDWDGFTHMNDMLGDKIQIVGDELTVTNIKRIQTAIEKKAINSVLIKLNQIGTLTETIQAIQLAKKQGWTAFVSHRSGETNDTFIADLAVCLSCECIKSGSLAREERVCKYNRLMEIEERLKAR